MSRYWVRVRPLNEAKGQQKGVKANMPRPQSRPYRILQIDSVYVGQVAVGLEWSASRQDH